VAIYFKRHDIAILDDIFPTSVIILPIL